MQVNETESAGLKRAFKVVIDAKDIEDKVIHRLEELKGQVRIPGFRPGKVPLKLLRQRFGQSVRGEILERAVTDSSQQALMERGLRPAHQPKIEIVSAEEEKDLEFTMEMEVLPEVEPVDFSAMEIDRPRIAVTDEEVDKTIERLAENTKSTETVTEERPAESGDVLVLDFKGEVDGETLPGMEGEDHHLELGSSSFIEGFEDQLTGARVGETKEVKVTFPNEYGNEKLAGKDAVFTCKIKELRKPVPAPVDDELAQSVGAESVQDLRDKIRERLQQQYDEVARGHMKRQLLDKLAEAHDFPVPDSLVEQEFGAIWHQIEHDREEGKLDPEDEGKSEEQLKEEYRQIAVRRVRLGLLLSEVGQRNQIQVTEEEMRRGLIQEAQRYPGAEQKIIELYQKNPEAMSQIRAPIFEDKVVDYICDLAQVTEREMTVDELNAAMKGEETEEAEESETETGKSARKKSAKKGTKKAAGGSKEKDSKEDQPEDGAGEGERETKE